MSFYFVQTLPFHCRLGPAPTPKGGTVTVLLSIINRENIKFHYIALKEDIALRNTDVLLNYILFPFRIGLCKVKGRKCRLGE